jgi:hypothetical protein
VFLGYNLRIMKKYLWIPCALVVVAAVVLMARYDKNDDTGSHSYDIKCVQSSKPSPTAASLLCTIDPKQNADQGQASPQWWHKLVAWPNGITAWLLMLTLGAIVWQAWETRKAAKAGADSANAAYGSVTFAEAQWQLTREKERARIEIKTADDLNLERIEGGFWHLKATIRIRNLGATRAYIRRGAGELFVGKTREETQPQLDTWNSLALDEDFIDPYSGKIFAVNRSFYFFSSDDETLADYATGIYEGRFSVHLYGVIEYETLGIRFRRDFGYAWLSNENPENVGAAFMGTPPAVSDEERISFGFWREDQEGNEEHVAEAN